MSKRQRNHNGPVLRRFGVVGGFLVAAIFASSFLLPVSPRAQSLPGGLPDIFNQIQQRAGQGGQRLAWHYKHDRRYEFTALDDAAACFARVPVAAAVVSA